ncbi:hypothetical protein [Polaromonas aquatica]|uniref:Uncharacterized protein n=1 Tax=Polaromonas aquatica TaxID=332657 RepID=A0ABW1U337_9BURK
MTQSPRNGAAGGTSPVEFEQRHSQLLTGVQETRGDSRAFLQEEQDIHAHSVLEASGAPSLGSTVANRGGSVCD